MRVSGFFFCSSNQFDIQTFLTVNITTYKSRRENFKMFHGLQHWAATTLMTTQTENWKPHSSMFLALVGISFSETFKMLYMTKKQLKTNGWRPQYAQIFLRTVVNRWAIAIARRQGAYIRRLAVHKEIEIEWHRFHILFSYSCIWTISVTSE